MARPKKRTRRASGTGSIFKDGDGYRVQIFLGKDTANDKPLFKKVRAKTHEEAREALAKLQHENRQGRVVYSKNLTLSAYLDSWLESKIKPLRAPKTYQQYKWVLTQHVIPTLGNKQLDKIRRPDVQKLIGALSTRTVMPRAKDPAAHAERKKKKAEKLLAKATKNGAAVLPPSSPVAPKVLGRRTLQSAVAVLHAAYQDAIRDGLTGINPCEFIELPQESKRAPQFLTGAQVEKLNKALSDSPIRELIHFMLCTGVRAGEARGLRWQDLDLLAGVARIAGQLQPHEGKLQYRPTTKTNQDRLLCIPEWMANELQELRSRQMIDGISDPEGIVFLNPFGNRLQEKYVWSLLRSACVKAEIAPVSPHKLRHTAATLALMETGDLHAVQKMLGHQQSRLTADLYAHATPERLRPVSDALGRIIGQSSS